MPLPIRPIEERRSASQTQRAPPRARPKKRAVLDSSLSVTGIRISALERNRNKEMIHNLVIRHVV